MSGIKMDAVSGRVGDKIWIIAIIFQRCHNSCISTEFKYNALYYYYYELPANECWRILFDNQLKARIPKMSPRCQRPRLSVISTSVKGFMSWKVILCRWMSHFDICATLKRVTRRDRYHFYLFNGVATSFVSVIIYWWRIETMLWLVHLY